MPRNARFRLFSLVAAVAACDHSLPVQPAPYPPLGPFTTTTPRRLTFNPGTDLAPEWLPDGSGIVYVFQRLDRPDHDRCLGVLPPDGGTLTLTVCNTSPTGDDSVDAYGSPAVSPGGRLLYTRASNWRRLNNAAPAYQDLVAAPLGAPLAVTELTKLPYTVPDGETQYGIAQVRWLGDTACVYVAELVAYVGNIPLDTLISGLELTRLDFTPAGPVFSSVPGTGGASSVALGRGDTIYYTLNGQSRVLRRALATGDTATIFDFGPAGIARDVQVRGNRLVAVVGGVVVYHTRPGLGPMPVQEDSGGVVHVVDLLARSDSAVPSESLLFRHPALSPDGRRLVLEAYRFSIVGADTIVGGIGDLWEFLLP